MTQPTLHPNLAKLAAAYDEILERLGRNQITAAAARAEIGQLEARDDQGVRWSIDPNNGQWLRKTAAGDLEYDPNPPTYGYETPDAHTYTPTSKVFDPSTRLQTVVVDPSMEQAPTNLRGVTQRPLAGAGASSGLRMRVTQLVGKLGAAPLRTKAVVAAALLVVLSLAMFACTPKAPAAQPTPAPTSTAPAKGPVKKAPAKTAKPAAKKATPTHQ